MYTESNPQRTPFQEVTVETIRTEDGVLREKSTGNPICMRTGTPITDPEYHIIAEDPRFPGIFMGPYNKDSWPYVKTCEGCHRPMMIDGEIFYYDNGVWLCNECSKVIHKCHNCGTACIKDIYINGAKMCQKCFNKRYIICEYSGDIEPIPEYSDIEEAEWPTIFCKYKKGSLSRKSFDELVSSGEHKRVPVSTCAYCESIFGGEGDYCPHCLEENEGRNIKPCSICNELTHIFYVDDTCKKCYTSHYTTCIYSSREVKKKNCVKIPSLSGGKYVDKRVELNFNRIAVCDLCNKIVSKNSLKTVKGYRLCAACEEVIEDEYYNRNSRINPYGFKPTPFFLMSKPTRTTKDNRLFFGIENEITFKSSEALDYYISILYDRYKGTVLYLKSDSSIQGHGVEVVSNPMTWNYLNNSGFADLFDIPPKDSVDIKNINSCGMHVHMSKGSFKNDMHLLKFIKIINNTRSCNGIINAIAGRGSCSYSKKMTKIEEKVRKSAKGGSLSRYSSVNLNPDKTVEIRIFSPCLSKENFLVRMSFLKALHEYTKDSALRNTVEDFFKSDIVKENKVLFDFYKEHMKGNKE